MLLYKYTSEHPFWKFSDQPLPHKGKCCLDIAHKVMYPIHTLITNTVATKLPIEQCLPFIRLGFCGYPMPSGSQFCFVQTSEEENETFSRCFIG